MISRLAACVLIVATPALADAAPAGPRDAVVMIIRHGEKPETGSSLNAAGQARAQAYVQYFQNFKVDGVSLRPDLLVAAKDSKTSMRPRQTLEPLAWAMKLSIERKFPSSKPDQLMASLHALSPGRRILICWRHGDIPNLLNAFGVDPASVLPKGKWPDATFDW